MSATGPALFISRKDQQEISQDEQKQLVALVKKLARARKLQTDEGTAAQPRRYDYGQYEAKGLGVLLYSSYILGEMPDDIRKDHEEAAVAEALKLGQALAKEQPGVYAFKAYFVED